MGEGLQQFLAGYPVLAPVFYTAIRALAIIIPPIPGGFIDLAGMALFGPIRAFILGEIGLMFGASTAFLIARRFREPAVRRFASLGKLAEWERQISERSKFWTLVLLRLPSNAVFDYISYAAGLTTVGFWKFFFSTLIGNLPGTIIFFLIGGTFYQSGWYYFIVFAAALIILGLIAGKGDKLAGFLRRFFTG
ncbi:TVP38/TMEM64 family protein [Candidatus Parcubacteria bacterium]|nr:MAG: TVP38/TMEM64 family protein [Candidatus Parcubacteria bacterium]